MHLAFLNFLAVDDISSLGTPEILDKVSVFLLADVEFSLLIVFKLWVVNHLLGNTLSSEKPDTFNVKVRLITKSGVHCQYVLSEMIDSLQEAVHQVQGLVKNLSLSWILLILDMVDSVLSWHVVVKEELNSFSLLVGVVHEESLVVVQVKLAGVSLVKFIKRINVFLGCFLTIFSLFSSCLGLIYSNWLFLGGQGRLDGLGRCLSVSNSVDNFWQLGNSFPPSVNVGHCLSESTIENCLES